MAGTIAHGFSSRMGVGAESTPGTPVAATEKVPFVDESITEVINEILDENLCGTAARSIGQPGTRIIEGGFNYNWRYELSQDILTHFFGTLSTDTPIVGTNTYSLDADIDGNALTVAIDKQVSVWEFSGYKVSELTITANPTDGIRVGTTGFGVSLDLASVLNTSASLAALTVPGDFMLFQDTTFRIADLVDALAAGDAIDISEFTITLNRNLEATEVNSQDRLEALENAFRDSTLTFTVPRYCDNTFVTAHRNHTPLQCDITITDGTSTKTILMPKLIVTEAPASVGGPGFIEHVITCQILPDPEAANAFITLDDTDSEIEIQES